MFPHVAGYLFIFLKRSQGKQLMTVYSESETITNS